MSKDSIDLMLLAALFRDSFKSMLEGLAEYILAEGGGEFTLWAVNGNICEPAVSKGRSVTGTFDIFDLGFSGGDFARLDAEVSFFDEAVFISQAFYFRRGERVLAVLTFHGEPPNAVLRTLTAATPWIAKRCAELAAKDRQMDVYIDYQKKIEFIKKGSNIFKALEVDNVIAVALSFFMEVFSAEALCAVYEGRFLSYGLQESDLETEIFVGEVSLKDYIEGNKTTEFLEGAARSVRFNIKNMFLVYEETLGLHFALFNIRVDMVPDKEFSDLVSSIVSIAVENARYHERMTDFKVEESEMTNTVEILNKFVQREIHNPGIPEVHGVNYPARRAGGDYVFVRRYEHGVFFCIADVCGKGYSAAVFTVALSAMGETGCSGQGVFDLAAFARGVNSYLISKSFNDRFITALFGIVDTERSTMQFISCGHEPAILVADGRVQKLSSEYVPLGIMPEEYAVKTVPVEKNSLFFAYTDGLIEYIDYDGLFEKIVERADREPKEIVSSLYHELVSDPENQKDDFTCILMKFS